MKKNLFLIMISIFFLMGLTLTTKAEEPVVNDKHQFRGVWVATVANIDMPKHTSEAQYKSEFLSVLDKVDEYNFNAIIFQVRPTNDAFYSSELNPWSKYLTGTQGNNPGWDPLSWMIEETHKRGIEFHAWMNPYRVTSEKLGTADTKDAVLNTLDELSFAKQNRDLVVVTNAGQLYLNPGEPQVKQFLIDTVDEIVSKYDVDGIHFDDYFYPDGGFRNDDDLATYNTYKIGNQTINEWRRSNVDDLVKRISDFLYQHNLENRKSVQFGISPFGIWRNNGTDPLGSATRGNSSYDAHHADTRKWVQEEWIDYIAPQLYWNIGFSVADYEILVKWWADVVKDTKVNLYIGHALHNYNDSASNTAWRKYTEIINQLTMNKLYPEVKGSIMYSYRHLNRSDSQALTTFRSILKSNEWNSEALTPILQRLDNPLPMKIQNVASEVVDTSNITLTWDKVDYSKYYVVYRFKNNETTDLTKKENIFAIVGNDPSTTNVTFSDSTVREGNEYRYYISVFYANGVEGEVVELKQKVEAPVIPTDPTTTNPTTTTTQTEGNQPQEPVVEPNNNNLIIVVGSIAALGAIGGFVTYVLRRKK